MTDWSWQQSLANETDAAKKEWMALERRYHLKLNKVEILTQTKHVSLFISLSDPALPARLKGQVELQMMVPERYPMEAACVDFAQWSGRLSDEQITALNAAVNAIAHQLCGGYALRKLLTWIDNNFWRVIAPFEIDIETDQGMASVNIAQTEAEVGVADKVAQVSRRQSQRPCRFFVRGNCRDGERCKFVHSKKEKRRGRNGGDVLETSDVDVSSVVRDADPTQLSEDAKVELTTNLDKKNKKVRTRKCKFFFQGTCRDGDKCKFSHELKNIGNKNNDLTQIPIALPPRAAVVQLGGVLTAGKELNADEKIEQSLLISVHDNIGTQREDSQEWSEAQQRALDLALKNYPATMDKVERWAHIANEVEGRSLNECIDRFKMLCELLRCGVDPTTPVIASIDKNDKEKVADVSENQVYVGNSKITPLEQRVNIVTEPDVKGTQIRLDGLFLHQVGSLVAHRLICQIQCDNCPLKFDAVLSLKDFELQKWCPRCSVLHHVLMRPVFAHSHSDVLTYVDTENCSIADVLPMDVLAACLNCGCEALLEKITPRQRSERTCFSCHAKLAVLVKHFVARRMDVSSGERNRSLDGAPAKGAKTSKKKGQKIVETFLLGLPLPRNGACDHYKHSLRWFRFQCCGKAFPCDVCHDLSDCVEANMGKFASRVICGLCSKEQPSSVKVCSCKNIMGSKRSTSRFWEGGTGCRNSSQMSRLDKQKYRGLNKTESTKFKRVGAEAKKRRNHVDDDA